MKQSNTSFENSEQSVKSLFKSGMIALGQNTLDGLKIIVAHFIPESMEHIGGISEVILIVIFIDTMHSLGQSRIHPSIQ